jgi:hypothetical protein
LDGDGNGHDGSNQASPGENGRCLTVTTSPKPKAKAGVCNDQLHAKVGHGRFTREVAAD